MTASEKVQQAWGDDAPEWVQVLADECDASSQAAAARAIGYSTAVISTVLKNTYRGDLGAVEQAVRGGLLNATVQCPVAGELNASQCLTYQRLPFKATNAQRVKLYKACRTCPNNRANQRGDQA